MGSGASKPRKLAKSAETAAKSVNRATVNQLPPKSLHAKFEQNHINAELKKHDNVDESMNQNPTQSTYQSNGFDPKLLKKKLNQNTGLTKPEHNLPEGKDGFDPHEAGTSTYDNQYVSNINNLGRQIHSHTPQHASEHSLALKQLKHRKAIFEEGEKEVQSQMDKSSNGIRTMVHPHTLGAILNDIHDKRVDSERITLDYQLHSDFVKELGTRFKVASNTVIIEEKTKDDELGHKVAPVSQMRDEGLDGDESERYKKLKDRISLD
ncbi:uncharacterized protein CANTADRAFT_8501 [Suhomyces tanzawaensis NRRL Y-17324]|uniref:Uncharacterized protein n=1 Tax=Suhomyces tanzawaensis NRRL Y-17324 TaxID=984487 RepID=A0A1E4SBT2_9ASCO|nr:uncharacterized protein CANTADRAFT_8501 [Suhomyces tanzawaensis NRRL Y-17324]ODV76926.1 hypothetical protein CANTADRAFT_8501 [Suhomyces tanzawaensis NRRL Y-17324]